MGKMLTAVFKDYLIFDDIYEFLDKFYKLQQSKDAIKSFALSQHSIAVQKYGFKPALDIDDSLKTIALTGRHENVVNIPSSALLSCELRKLLYNNKRLKYLMKYEKRVVEKEY